MEKLSAFAGWAWIKQGFALFRKQPFEWITLFFSYFFFLLGLSLIPFAGVVLIFLLKPALSMAFLQGGAEAEQGKRIYPSLLLTGFRSPALSRLIVLGALSLVTTGLAIGASMLVDGGVLWKVMSGQLKIDPQTVENSNLSLAMLTAAAVYMPMEMALWYAPALAVWKNMGTGKALFYSFFAVKRMVKPFLVYGLAWIGIMLTLSPLTALLDATVGKPATMMLSMLVIVIICCSFYPTYTAYFGKPYEEPEPAPASEPDDAGTGI
ncbi:MAG: hypothetical protein K0S28_1826 [Paucimonas sp.]|jgi:hypothetical protein|nr:hypothetical protein [Paucimonas sp.]